QRSSSNPSLPILACHSMYPSDRYTNPPWIRRFFFNRTSTTQIYTLSLHDALPIWATRSPGRGCVPSTPVGCSAIGACGGTSGTRSEEHTSELQSLAYLVCRLLLEKKKSTRNLPQIHLTILKRTDDLIRF